MGGGDDGLDPYPWKLWVCGSGGLDGVVGQIEDGYMAGSMALRLRSRGWTTWNCKGYVN